MRRPVLMLIAGLLLVLVAWAQIISSTPRDTAQSGGLEEVNRLNESVVRLYEKGKFKEALPLARRALEIAEKALGAEHPQLAPLLANLAEVHIGLKQYQDAEPLARRSLTILEKALGADHPDLRNTLYRLALVRHLAGEDAESETLYRRAVSISEKAFGAEHIEVAISLEKLALFYGAQDTMKAGEIYNRLANIVEKAPDTALSGIGQTMSRYACLKSKLKQATNLYEGSPAPNEPFSGTATVLGKPKIPIEARRSKAQGRVPVRVLIDEDGKVIQACAMSGPKVFAEAAEEAALLSSFTQTVVTGKPVKVKGIITFNFVAR